MPSRFEFDHVVNFFPFTIGPPGQRVFFLQVTTPDQSVQFRCEKAQVEALGSYLQAVARLPSGDEFEPMAGIGEHLEPEWIVGQIAVAADESTDRILVLLSPLPEDQTQLDAMEDVTVDPYAQILLDPLLAHNFAVLAEVTVSGGRPTCELCELPMDPAGHQCARLN